MTDNAAIEIKIEVSKTLTNSTRSTVKEKKNGLFCVCMRGYIPKRNKGYIPIDQDICLVFQRRVAVL